MRTAFVRLSDRKIKVNKKDRRSMMIDFKKIIGVTAAGAMLMGTVACGNKRGIYAVV